MSKTLRTRARLHDAALRLFVDRGFEAVTVGEIAEAAGVSAMTFFRYFSCKEDAALFDPFDPVIAEAVAAAPATLPPLLRITSAIRAGLSDVDVATMGDRAALGVIARTPALRARMWENQRTTQQAIVDALVGTGTARPAAEAAAGAFIGAATSVLLSWAAEGAGSMADALAAALDTLEQR